MPRAGRASRRRALWCERGSGRRSRRGAVAVIPPRPPTGATSLLTVRAARSKSRARARRSLPEAEACQAACTLANSSELTRGPASNPAWRLARKVRSRTRSCRLFDGLATIWPQSRFWTKLAPPWRRGGARFSLKKKDSLCRGFRRECSRAWQREQSVSRSSSAFDPSTAWWTESRLVAPQRTQRFPSRSLAARLSRCHAERSSSGREEPERCGRAQRAHRPCEPGGRTTPQLGQRRASAMSD
jgi:hypothetical protein